MEEEKVNVSWLLDQTGLELTRAAQFDPKKAKEALLLAARVMNEKRQISIPLASYLADAINAAFGSGKSPEVENTKFLEALGLKGGHRRKESGDFAEIGSEVEVLLGEQGKTKISALNAVAQRRGISLSTVKRRHSQYLQARNDSAAEE